MSANPSASPISFDELLRHNEEETERWRRFTDAYPEALDQVVEVAQMKDVRGAVLHIALVELLYAERMVGIPRDRLSYDDFPVNSVDQLFSYHNRALELMRKTLLHPGTNWDEVLTFGTKTSSTLSASRRKMFFHTMLHSIRHWAQIAMVLRQRGFKQDWQHDFIFTQVMV